MTTGSASWGTAVQQTMQALGQLLACTQRDIAQATAAAAVPPPAPPLASPPTRPLFVTVRIRTLEQTFAGVLPDTRIADIIAMLPCPPRFNLASALLSFAPPTQPPTHYLLTCIAFRSVDRSRIQVRTDTAPAYMLVATQAVGGTAQALADQKLELTNGSPCTPTSLRLVLDIPTP